MMETRTPLIALGLALAACSPAPTGNEIETPANAAVDAAEDDVANASDSIFADQNVDASANNAEAPKSILRPDVVEEAPAPPPLEPIALVIPFGTSGMTLDDAGRAALDEMLAERAVAAGGPITIRGHTDSRGYDGDNLVASRKRAEVVRAYLRSKGVAADRMTLVALGETRPIAPNAAPDGSDDPEGRAKNRRVEVEVALPAPAPAPIPTIAAAAPGAAKPAPARSTPEKRAAGND